MNRKNYFITGLFSIIPIAITYFIITKLFSVFSKPGQTLIKTIFPEVTLPFIDLIMGFILTFLFIYFLGLIVSNVIGKKLYSFLESILSRIPLVSYIYNTIKQITETLTVSHKHAFKKVVYIEYPKEEIWTIALVTGESKDKNGISYYQIFVPTTPNPTSGFMLYIKKINAKETDLSIDEGLKIVISGGMLAPEENEI
tara:strand:- start:35 stop:628 length:594 start_codon:yes stop_codon:yes gene_type:complete